VAASLSFLAACLDGSDAHRLGEDLPVESKASSARRVAATGARERLPVPFKDDSQCPNSLDTRSGIRCDQGSVALSKAAEASQRQPRSRPLLLRRGYSLGGVRVLPDSLPAPELRRLDPEAGEVAFVHREELGFDELEGGLLFVALDAGAGPRRDVRLPQPAG